MKRLIFTLLFLAQLVWANEGYYLNRVLFCLHRDQPDLTILYKNGQPRTDFPQINALLEKYQARILEKWLRSADDRDIVGDMNLSKVYRVEFVSEYSPQELQQIKEEFAAIPAIHSADFEGIYYVKDEAQVDPYVPNDSRYNEQWYIRKIQANDAWGLWWGSTPGDTDVLVGVVDTGVDYEHPELSDVMYINPGEDINHDEQFTSADINGVDDDGNGYVDDVRGWDFADNNNDIRPPSSGVDDALSHGTHCSGIIGAMGDNNEGIAGVAFRVKIIGTKNTYDSDSTNSNPSIVNGYDAILYTAKLGAKFINCSWGSIFMSSYEQSILDDVSDNYGAIVIGAAGNDNHSNDGFGRAQYPADYSKCISVAATDNTDHKASYSNWGSAIDISAPGGEYGGGSTTAILSTIHWNAGGYDAWAGTSMATPVVVGSFALLKAWFPSQSRQWYIDQLLNHADPIDDLNPDYAGKLGSGRVNIYNSIARNSYPYLTVDSYSIQIINDNGDGQLNPGESAKIVLTIANDPNYQDANNVQVTASSASGYFTFSDGTANLGTIAAGGSATNSSDDIVFQVNNDAPLQPLTIQITKKANQSGTYPYTHTEDITIQPQMNQTDYPITSIKVSDAVAAGDLTGDSKLEVAAVSEGDSLYLFDASGNLQSGFPMYLGGTVSMGPVIADMNNDGDKEIVISERVNGYLKIINGDGSLMLDMTVGEQIRSELTVADLNNDGNLEIIFGTMSKKLHAIQIDGSELSGFPITYASQIDKGVAVGDVDGDNQPELAFDLVNTDFYVIEVDGTTLNGFPYNLPARLSNKPVIANVKGTIYYVLTTTGRDLIILNSAGGEVLNFDTVDPVNATPSLCDVNNDGELEIAFGTDNSTGNYGKLYLMNFNGDTLAPFPKTLDAPINTSPVFADLDGDGQFEIMTSTEGGYIYCFRADGSYYKNFPAFFDGAQNGSGCIRDIDLDGDFEVIVGGANGLNVVDVQEAKGTQTNIWQDYQANTQHTNYYYYPGSSSLQENNKVLPESFALSQNYPNPFNPETKINYALPVAGEVKIIVFNILGQKVKTLVNEFKTAGTYSVKWNGFDDSGNLLANGVYIYKMQVNASKTGKRFSAQRKMIFIK
ncbi:MAG: S8 family serine peptidase [Caldisericaceae bacterium]|nr:S8 family serine peptidase [Caldisericaceae bacterium]